MKIEPALTPEQWKIVRTKNLGPQDITHPIMFPASMPPLIALANDGLLDSDQRKMTHDWIRELRIAQETAQDSAWRACSNGEPGKPCDECQQAVDRFKARLQRIADAIESYLPPRVL